MKGPLCSGKSEKRHEEGKITITAAIISGYYADRDLGCQGYHVCLQESGEARRLSFLCPNGTIFDQQYFICSWW